MAFNLIVHMYSDNKSILFHSILNDFGYFLIDLNGSLQVFVVFLVLVAILKHFS